MSVISSIRESISGAYDQYKQRVAHDEGKLLAAAKSFGSLFFSRFVVHYPPAEQPYVQRAAVPDQSSVKDTPVKQRSVSQISVGSSLNTPPLTEKPAQPLKGPTTVEEMTDYLLNLSGQETDEELVSVFWESGLNRYQMEEVQFAAGTNLSSEHDAGRMQDVFLLGQTVGHIRDGIQKFCQEKYEDCGMNYENFLLEAPQLAMMRYEQSEILGYEFESDENQAHLIHLYNRYLNEEAKTYLKSLN